MAHEFNRDIEICRVLAKYSNFSSDELHSLLVKYETVDGLIIAMEYANRFNCSLELSCKYVIPIKEK